MPDQDTPSDFWENLARSETHPLRISILEVFLMDGGRTISPVELAFELQEKLGIVNYHVSELRKSGILRLADEEQVRGAMKHFYCLADRATGNLRRPC